MSFNMSESWNVISELNSGDISTVYKCKHKKITNRFAAAKVWPLADDVSLSDCAQDIELLSSAKHNNIVNLYEAYYLDKQLWVCIII